MRTSRTSQPSAGGLSDKHRASFTSCPGTYFSPLEKQSKLGISALGEILSCLSRAVLLIMRNRVSFMAIRTNRSQANELRERVCAVSLCACVFVLVSCVFFLHYGREATAESSQEFLTLFFLFFGLEGRVWVLCGVGNGKASNLSSKFGNLLLAHQLFRRS